MIFLCGAVVGNLVPGFFDLYQQRLQARLEQVSVDLAPFQVIADRYHGGSLAALVQYHLASDDPTFHDEGVALRAMMDNRAELTHAVDALEAPLYDRAIYVARHADTETARQTWDAYRPSITMRPDVLLWSLATGAALCLVGWMLSIPLRRFGRRAG